MSFDNKIIDFMDIHTFLYIQYFELACQNKDLDKPGRNIVYNVHEKKINYYGTYFL